VEKEIKPDNSNPLRIAQIMGKMEKGGVESVVMNYYRHIDKNKIQFDFIVDSDSTCPQEQEILSLGGRVYKVAPYQNIKQNMSDIQKIFELNKYKIMHSQLTTMSVFSLKVGEKCNIPVRICHGHNTASKGETKKNVLKYMLRPFSKKYATHYFACSEYAGKWLFGNKTGGSKLTVLNNAIDLEKFSFDNDMREKLRAELGLENKFVLGNIGRFCFQKNHDFLIDVFYRVYKMDNSAVLMLIGEGELVDTVREKVRSLNLEKSVLFLEPKENINDYYQAMDVFVLPSHYEGFGIVALEAQAAGVPTICSDKVPNVTRLSEDIEYISLDTPADKWAEAIMLRKNAGRKNSIDYIRKKGYDIKVEARKLEDIYINMIKAIPHKD